MAEANDTPQGTFEILKRYVVLWFTFWWRFYKRCTVLMVTFCWSVLTGMWTATSRIVGDTLQRWESVRLKGEVEKQKIALGEKLLSSGAGDAGLRQRLLAKDHEIQQAESNKTSTKTLIAERRTMFSALGSAAWESTDTSNGTTDIRTAQDALDTHEQKLSQLIATRPPIKKRAWVGLGLLLLMFVSAIGTPSKDRQSKTENLTSNDQQAVLEKAAVKKQHATQPAEDTPTREEQIKLVYTAAAVQSLKHPIGSGPSPEEFIDLTHEVARQLQADRYDHSRFLLTLKPDRDKATTAKGLQGRVLTYGPETALFVKSKITDRYTFMGCSIDGEQKMNLSGN